MSHVFIPCLAVLISFLPLFIIKNLMGVGIISFIISGIVFILVYLIIVYFGLSTSEKQYFAQSVLSYKPFHKD